MPNFFKRLFEVGGWAATLLTFITTGWGVLLSAALALLAFCWTAAAVWVDRPVVKNAGVVFLFCLWTYIGLSYLYRRKHPVLVKSHQDYKYGLTFEGVAPMYNPFSEDMLGFSIIVRNYTPGPLACKVEYFNVTLDNRILPRFKQGVSRYYLPRGGGRQLRQGVFKSTDLAQYRDRSVSGEVEFAIAYGPPQGAIVRILKMRIEINVNLGSNAMLAWGDNIVEESDEDYDARLFQHLGR